VSGGREAAEVGTRARLLDQVGGVSRRLRALVDFVDVIERVLT
jgi:hypothetical protein